MGLGWTASTNEPMRGSFARRMPASVPCRWPSGFTGDGSSGKQGWANSPTLPKSPIYFASLGVPAPAFTAYFIGVLEVGGGILLALGLGSRVIAVLLAGHMIEAYVSGDPEALKSVISDPCKFYNADPFHLHVRLAPCADLWARLDFS
jgi:hypothetical protein